MYRRCEFCDVLAKTDSEIYVIVKWSIYKDILTDPGGQFPHPNFNDIALYP